VQRIYKNGIALKDALASLLVSSAVAAQTAETRTAIVMINAPIYVRPDVSRTPLRVAAENTSLKVVLHSSCCQTPCMRRSSRTRQSSSFLTPAERRYVSRR